MDTFESEAKVRLSEQQTKTSNMHIQKGSVEANNSIEETDEDIDLNFK